MPCRWDPPETDLPKRALGFRHTGVRYDQVARPLHSRQLVGPDHLLRLGGGSDGARQTGCRCRRSARRRPPVALWGAGATAYAEAVGVYLAFALSKVSNVGSSLTSWMNDRGAFRETFARHAIPMVWDFAESESVRGRRR